MTDNWIYQVVTNGIGGTHLGGELSTSTRDSLESITGRLSLVPFLTSASNIERALNCNQVIKKPTYSEKQQAEMLETNYDRAIRREELFDEILTLQSKFIREEFPSNKATHASFSMLNEDNKLFKKFAEHPIIKDIRKLQARHNRLSPIPNDTIYKFTYTVPQPVVDFYLKVVHDTKEYKFIPKQF